MDHVLVVGAALGRKAAVEGVTRGETVQIDSADQVVSGAGLIPEGNEQIVYRLIFDLQRIVINVGGRHVPRRTVDLDVLVVADESTRQLGGARRQ